MAGANSTAAKKNTRNIPQHNNWLEKLNAMRLSGDETDITLVCEGTPFHAHRLILMASSPVFDTMFRSDFKEAQLGTVDMKVDPKSMKRVLDFIYLLGDVPMLFEDVHEAVNALAAAHYLQIPQLYRKCCDQVLKMASAADFPLIYSLNKYEDLPEEFTEENGFQILHDNLHLGYDVNQFRMFVNQVKPVVASQDLLGGVWKWLKHDIINREKHAEEFVLLVDLTSIPRSCLKCYVSDKFVRKNEKLHTLLTEQLFTDASESVRSVKSSRNEKRELIESLALFQFSVDKDGIVRVLQTPFVSTRSKPACEVVKLPLEPVNSIVCASWENRVCFATATSDEEVSMVNVIEYVPNSDKVQFLWHGNLLTSNLCLKQLVMSGGDVLVITKPNTKGVGVICYHSNMYDFCKYKHSGSDSIWIPWSYDSVASISRTGNVNSVGLYDRFHNHITPRDSMEFQSPYAFESRNTVSMDNSTYSFVKDKIYVYDLSKRNLNGYSVRQNGITITDDDVFFSLNRGFCYKTLYVVIRRNRSETEYSYHLWEVGSSSFAAEMVANKGATCETFAVVNM